MNTVVRKVLDCQATIFRTLGKMIRQHTQECRCKSWYANKGDETLRLRYDLTADSVVFDIGGFEGQWASDIFSRYSCSIHVFEPVPEFTEAIRRRFCGNEKIKVYPYGLAHEDMNVSIFLDREGSSVHRRVSADSCRINLRHAGQFLLEQEIDRIDLMKINIEGAEYDLLEHLIETGWVQRIRNIQVQFHDFVPQAEKRMWAIQKALMRTHTLTYRYVFVWESWRLCEAH